MFDECAGDLFLSIKFQASDVDFVQTFLQLKLKHLLHGTNIEYSTALQWMVFPLIKETLIWIWRVRNTFYCECYS